MFRVHDDQVWTGTIIGIFSGAISYYVGEGLPCFGYDPCLTTEQLWCAP